MFGPVYHGTTEDRLSAIEEEGFKVFVGTAHSGAIQHGFGDVRDYGAGVPPPVHFLGYGVYFTTVKSISKQYGVSKMYYLDVPSLEVINFGSPNTMTRWWIRNGYDPEMAHTDRVIATQMMTGQLASQFDAVWFKGKSIRRLLDGDQICVYDPSRIYRIDNKLSPPFGVGSKVRRKSDGMIGMILRSERLAKSLEKFPLADWMRDLVASGSERLLTVRWAKGGTQYQVPDGDVVPYAGRGIR